MSNEEEGNGRIPKLHKLILKNFAVPSEGENCLKSSRYKKKKIRQIKIVKPLDFDTRINKAHRQIQGENAK
jgi:hypothetical protein